MLRLHLGLVLLCIFYIVAGAAVFYYVEKPEEIRLIRLDYQKFVANFSSALSVYESTIFNLFEYPVSFTLFNTRDSSELWTASSSVLFTATTMIPIGFGLVTPVTKLGRILLICFAATGIPLAVATLADLGKFICQFLCKSIKNQSLLPPAIVFTAFLVYPVIGGFIICYITSLDFFDSLYYCIMTILMIGYGDFSPSIPLIFLLAFIVLGVILVTVSIDAVGADIINHIHFMGRQVGKAKAIAEKMVQKVSMNKGLEAGVAQLNALAKFTVTIGFKSSIVLFVQH
uniref:Ion channel n=1 Tax=Syphacia muris TaxID=451379 RepID=A0A0N5APU3_9BILA